MYVKTFHTFAIVHHRYIFPFSAGAVVTKASSIHHIKQKKECVQYFKWPHCKRSFMINKLKKKTITNWFYT